MCAISELRALSIAVTVYCRTIFCFPCATRFGVSEASAGFAQKYIKGSCRISPRITCDTIWLPPFIYFYTKPDNGALGPKYLAYWKQKKNYNKLWLFR
jgi:hypothetical protein